MKLNAVYSLVVLSAVALVSCNKGGENKGPDEEREGQRGFDASCVVPVDQGDGFSPSMVRTASNRSALVAKTYDQNFFELAERLSGRGLAELSANRDVKLSLAEESQLGACLQYTFLQRAPRDVQAEWDRISADAKSRGSRLLGVFFPEGTDEMPSASDHGYVAVSADTTKWTVFHELMHNEFFQTERVRRGYLNSDQNQYAYQSAVRTLTPYIQDSPRTPSQTEVANLTRDAVRYAKSLRRLMRDFYLEEVTIESMLLRSYNQGRFLNAADESESSVGYMISSYQRADFLKQRLERLVSRMRNWPTVDSSSIDQIQAVLNGGVDTESNLPSVSAMLSEARSATEAAIRENNRRSGRQSGVMSFRELVQAQQSRGGPQHGGCSHGLPHPIEFEK